MGRAPPPTANSATPSTFSASLRSEVSIPDITPSGYRSEHLWQACRSRFQRLWLGLGDFDAAFPETLVIFLARVFHHFPVGPQRERACVLPRLREGLRILDGHFPVDVTEVGPREALHEMQPIAVRMADRIQPGLAVEVDRVDHQRVAFPATDRIAEPRRDALAMRTAID